jgi:integrase
MFQVMFSTAFRFSELAGLTWNDVDFDDRTISLNHQVYYMDYGDGYKYHCESPKSDAGVRVIPMTQNCYKALKLQREYQFAMGVDREKETAGLKGFVFTTTRGTPYNTQNIWTLIRRISNRYNEEELESAEKEGRVPVIMPDMSSHTFRHTGCTRLAETKMDVKSLQEFMGHSDIKVTMDVYDHIVGNRMKNEIEEAERKNDAI